MEARLSIEQFYCHIHEVIHTFNRVLSWQISFNTKVCTTKIFLTIPCKYCDGKRDNQLAFYWRQRTLISKGIHSLPAVTLTEWRVHSAVPERNMTGCNWQDTWQFIELFLGGVTVQLSEVWHVRDGLPSITLDKQIHKSWFIFAESIHRQVKQLAAVRLTSAGLLQIRTLTVSSEVSESMKLSILLGFTS